MKSDGGKKDQFIVSRDDENTRWVVFNDDAFSAPDRIERQDDLAKKASGQMEAILKMFFGPQNQNTENPPIAPSTKF